MLEVEIDVLDKTTAGGTQPRTLRSKQQLVLNLVSSPGSGKPPCSPKPSPG